MILIICYVRRIVKLIDIKKTHTHTESERIKSIPVSLRILHEQSVLIMDRIKNEPNQITLNVNVVEYAVHKIAL